MEKNKPFQFKLWMFVAIAVATLLIIFNFDPIGDMLEKTIGQGAEKWFINIVLVALIVYTFIKKKWRRRERNHQPRVGKFFGTI